MQKRSFKLAPLPSCSSKVRTKLSINIFLLFFRSTVASFWVLLSGLFGCQSEQRTKNIVISVRSGVFVKSTPPTTQTADVARYFKKRQTFCSFVFLRKSSRQSRAFLNGFAKISKDKSKQEGTCTSGVSAGKRQGSWDNLQKWKSVGFTCITFG